jgi:putative ABC transport system permease protein
MRSLFARFRTVSTRYLWKRWNRAGLIVASIALGVGMLVTTQLLNRCIDAAASESASPGVETADLVVTANRRVQLGLVPKLRNVPGIKAVSPMLVDRVVLPGFGNRSAVLIGLDVAAGKATNENSFQAQLNITNPLAWVSGRGVVIGQDLASVMSPDGRPTRPFEIRCGGRLHKLEPVGAVQLQGKAAKLGGFLLVMDVYQAARAMGQEGICERIDLQIEAGADLNSIRAAAQAAIGDLATVETPEAAVQSTKEVVGGVRISLTLCGIGAIIVGLFLVYNALAVSVAERRHDIGVLRSMGANRRQIAGLFTFEALTLGLVGSLLGLPLGLAVAKLTFSLVRLQMEQIFLTANQPLELTRSTILLAIVAGLATSWFAALVPAMQAASDEPADAVRRDPSSAGRFFLYLQALASLALIGMGMGFVMIRDYLPQRVGGLCGMALLLVGMLWSVPLLVGLLARLLQPFARRLFGIETRLAADNLLRAPGRTGVVVGALAAGVALMFQTAGIGKSNEEPVLEWLDRAVSADMFVVSGDPNAAIGIMAMQPEVAQQLRAIPGVETTMTIRYAQPDFNGRVVFLTAIDAQVYHDSNRNRSKLPKLGLFKKLLEPNTCLVSENFAALNHVGPGDTIALQGPHGPVSLQIAGAIPEYSWSRGTILVDRNFYAKVFEDPLVDSIHVFLQPECRDEAWKRVKEFTDSQALLIVTRDEFNKMVTSVIRRMYAMAYLLQTAVAIEAVLGVVMALLISVLQRRRELGLLRAVGATQRQVLRTVLAEATLMGIFGVLLGVAAGLPLEWYLLRVVIFEDTGFIFPVTFPWRETLILSCLAVGTATIAGLFPAIQAVRLRIAEAIAYE